MRDTVGYQKIRYDDQKTPYSYILNKSLRGHEQEPLSDPKWHEQIEIKYFVSGRAEITCGPRIFIAQKGDIVIINPFERHAIRELAGEDACYHMLIADTTLAISGESVRALEDVAAGRLRFNELIREDETAKTILLRLFEALPDEGRYASLRIAGLMLEWFAYLLEHHLSSDSLPILQDGVKRYAEQLESAFEIIALRYADPLTLEELAAACGISIFHFCRMFKAVTGQTTINYLGEYRVNKAALLLRSTELPVAEIAHAVGFADECYFSRCFRRFKEISPSLYRRRTQQQKQNNPD